MAFDADGRFLNPRFREYVSTTSTADFDRHAGLGLAVEDVIDTLRRQLAFWWKNTRAERRDGHHQGVPDAALVTGWPDLTVWEADRVVAVLRARVRPDGSAAFKVTRFDRPGPKPVVEADA